MVKFPDTLKIIENDTAKKNKCTNRFYLFSTSSQKELKIKWRKVKSRRQKDRSTKNLEQQAKPTLKKTRRPFLVALSCNSMYFQHVLST